jgi:hypothetical protein
MICGSYNYWGKSKLALIYGTVNSESFQEILQGFIFSLINKQNSQTQFFSRTMQTPMFPDRKIWLKDNNIETMYWPPFLQT